MRKLREARDEKLMLRQAQHEEIGRWRAGAGAVVAAIVCAAAMPSGVIDNRRPGHITINGAEAVGRI